MAAPYHYGDKTFDLAISGQQRQQTEQRQLDMLGMAAERLRALGPEGEQWANNLIQNPHATNAMAQQMGGFQEIEQRLQRGMAAGQSAEARIAAGQPPMDPVQQQVFGQEGAAGLKDLGSARSSFAQARTAGQPERKAVDLMLTTSTAEKLRKEAENAFKGHVVQRDLYGQAIKAIEKAAESGTLEDWGAADFALVQAYGKLLDPDSVVRNEEGEFIQRAGSSKQGEILHNLSSLLGLSGVMDAKARGNLLKMLEASNAAAMEAHTEKWNIRKQEISGFPVSSEFTRDLALPAMFDPANFQRDFDMSVYYNAPPTPIKGYKAPGAAGGGEQAKWEALDARIKAAGGSMQTELGRVYLREDGEIMIETDAR